MALLREDARAVLRARGLPREDGPCQALTHAHLEAIRRRLPRSIKSVIDTASAILDATPSMLEWWCVRLDRTD